MVYAEMMTYLRSWVNVYSCLRMCHFSKHTRNERNTHDEEFMGKTIVCERLYARIASNDLALVISRRVAKIGSLYVSGKYFLQFRKFLNNLR